MYATESFYMAEQNKNMHIIDDELYFVIEEQLNSVDIKEKGIKKDKIRTTKIENRNLTVMRIPNNEINNNFRGVCEYIDYYIKTALFE